MVTEHLMVMVAMLVATVEVRSYGGGERGRAGDGAVEVDKKSEVVVAKEKVSGYEGGEGFYGVGSCEGSEGREPEVGMDQQLYPPVVAEEMAAEKLMAEVDLIAVDSYGSGGGERDGYGYSTI
ncbi:hypothetical protein Bca52824_024416 [Brassica carinata]|uniref:Uncharacterized protein n=1 Tax=Brassica carinata TaxID=52824 RepID=A0A8X7VKF4_BRACI|nr:hypothetical protein Bca52824_024416 [Brassica carinata]